MNNINSILMLQADSLKDRSAIAALEDAGSRVQSMIVLYNKLYGSADFIKLPIVNYLPPLIDKIPGNFPDSSSFRIVKNINDFILDATRLQPIGIIVNELLTNIMQHAFHGRSDGEITVSAELTGNRVSITIQDNGTGMPDSINFENSTGFGMQLVSILTAQLEGNISIVRGDGTKFVLEFSL